MNLVKQVIRDIIDDWIWVLLFSFTMVAIIMALVLVGLNFEYTLENFESVNSLLENEVVMVRSMPITLAPQITEEGPTELAPREVYNNLNQAVREIFVEDGPAATFVSMAINEKNFTQLIVFVGKYPQLLHLKLESQPVLLASYDQRAQIGRLCSVGSHEIKISGAVQKDFNLIHPLSFMSGEQLMNTLYLFLPTSEQFAEYTKYGPYPLPPDSLLDRLLLINPTDEEINTISETLYNAANMYCEVASMEDYIVTSTQTGIRTSVAYLLFYILSGALLLFSVVYNIYLIVRKRNLDYRINYLYGATKTLTALRIFFFILAYQLLPYAALIYILEVNRAATLAAVSGSTLAIFMVSFSLSVWITHRVLQLDGAQNYRRD